VTHHRFPSQNAGAAESDFDELSEMTKGCGLSSEELGGLWKKYSVPAPPSDASTSQPGADQRTRSRQQARAIGFERFFEMMKEVYPSASSSAPPGSATEFVAVGSASGSGPAHPLKTPHTRGPAMPLRKKRGMKRDTLSKL